jgi:hypothetical protein
MKTALKRFGFDDTDPLVSWLNAAMWEFETEYNWTFTDRFAQVTVPDPAPGSADNVLFLPSDYTRLISCRCISPVVEPALTVITVKDYVTLIEGETFGTSGTPGTPTHIVATGPTGNQGGARYATVIYPASDTTRIFLLEYRGNGPAMVGDVDTPLLVPDEFHYDGIVEGAAVKGYSTDNAEDKMASHKDVYDRAVSRAVGLYLSKAEGAFDQVRDAQDYGTTT